MPSQSSSYRFFYGKALGMMLHIVLLLMMTVAVSTAAQGPSEVHPSANQGRLGKYHVDLGGGYGYWLMVPACYSATAPAGLHLYFHGQNGQNWADQFDGWDGPFLSAYNLIGINMQYMDGDNGRDTAGKARAARSAIAQTIADYKILIGRGVICSFSGGGLPHSILSNESSKTRGALWPFCHSAIYSSNYRTDAAQGCPMSWFVSVGVDEWSLAGLGADGTARTNELYRAVAKGGCPDIHFKITKGKGHTIIPAEIAASAVEFARSDLAFAPFLYLPDYADPELRGVASACDALALGPAMSHLGKLKAKTTLPATVKAKLPAIENLISTRIQRLMTMSRQLSTEDPVLSCYYLPIYLQECRGTPQEKELRQMIHSATMAKGYQSTLQRYSQFIDSFSTLLRQGSAPEPDPAQVPALRAVVAGMLPTSQTGAMAAEILALSP